MLASHMGRAIEIGDGPSDLEHAVVRPRREAEFADRHFERAFAGFIESAVPPYDARRHARVVEAARLLDGPSGDDALADLRGGFGGRIATQFLVRHGRHFDVDIDPVQKRP